MTDDPSSFSCFVYVIGSIRDGEVRTYVGWTNNLEKRIATHNSGKGAKSTRGREWVLLYSEEFKTRGEAMSREWHLKRDHKFRGALRDTFRKQYGRDG
ncbi:GIY-YIG nuclease family protein [Kordiimonas marina]|uniref:GIY-YIG nuclease family protein n=1 Tax=Kordiimonas marina TaxID=2872312 RepID=UPI001FF4A7E6|nr:GIY-YIG nuclease family protein [Kordiimonas marina]